MCVRSHVSGGVSRYMTLLHFSHCGTNFIQGNKQSGWFHSRIRKIYMYMHSVTTLLVIYWNDFFTSWSSATVAHPIHSFTCSVFIKMLFLALPFSSFSRWVELSRKKREKEEKNKQMNELRKRA